MKRVCIAILSAVLLASAPGRAAEGEDVLLGAVRDGQAAIRAWTFERITNAAAAVASAPAEDDAAVFRRDYWEGCLLFHAVVFLREEADKGADTPDASPYRERGIDALTRAVSARPETAEAHAMISVLNGMAIDDHPLSAIWRGRSLMKHRKLALKHGEYEPRTRFLLGVSTFKRAGGDEDEILAARVSLEAALALFNEETGRARTPWDPAWGRDHTLLFLGRVDEALGHYDRAGMWYHKALTENENLSSAAEGFERCRNQTEKQ